MEKGQRYRVEIALPEACTADEATAPSTTRRTGAWSDWTIPVTSPAGFSSLDVPGGSAIQTILLTLAVPLRRDITANWLVPVAEIGTTNPLRVPLVEDTFVAGQDGPLSLWVNDLILPCPGVGLLLSQQRWRCGHRADHESGVTGPAAAAREAYVSVTPNA